MTRTPSPTTLKVRAYAKVQHLKDEIAAFAEKRKLAVIKYDTKIKMRETQLTDAEVTYNELLEGNP